MKLTGAKQQNQDDAAAAKNDNGVDFVQTGTLGNDKKTHCRYDGKDHLLNDCKKINEEDKSQIFIQKDEDW